MDNVFRFENLNIYKESLTLCSEIYAVTKSYPKEEQFGIINQFRRAASSIVLNIAEGSSRTRKDFAHFLSLSKGSCFECVAILDISRNQGYINQKDHGDLYEKLNKLSRMISKFQISLRRATIDER